MTIEHLVFVFEPADQLFPHEVRHGPFDEYAAEHAALYRPRRDA